MIYANDEDILAQLQGHGFLIDRVSDLVVGKIERCQVRDCTQKGWYSLHEITLDGGERALIGAGRWFKGAETFPFKFELNVNAQRIKLSSEQEAAARRRIAEERKRDDEARRARSDRAAIEAQRVWAAYVTVGHSDYLERKAVGAHGVRFDPNGAGTLAVPMCNARGIIRGLQIIRGKSRGGKLEKQYFPKGVSTSGLFHLIGMPSDIILLCEGYATGATLHECTGLPVAVAFDSGNLSKVAIALHKHYPDAHLLVCADDDYLTGDGGAKAAEAAALSVGGAWIKPEFPADRDGKKLTDFNDLWHFPQGGAHAVRTQVEATIATSGWQLGSASRAATVTEGGGGGDGKRPAAQSVMMMDDIVARFIPLDDGTGKFVFDTWTRKMAHREQMIALLPAGVRGDDIKRHPVWISRGAYYLDQLGFDPSMADPGVKLNTFVGWPLEPKQGKCDLIIEHFLYLCSAEKNADEVFRWLMCWLAYPLQNPGAKMATAVLMHGPQGTGKSTAFDIMMKIYGDYGVTLDQRGLEDRFNSDWADSKLFVKAEEIAAPSELWAIKGEMKALITDEWIRVNPKNLPAYRQRNHINLVCLSNEYRMQVLDQDDRRNCVICTPPRLDAEFYDDLYLEIEHGGVEAFYHYLMNFDLAAEKFHPKKQPPNTESKERLILLSLPSDQRFLQEWVMGEIGLPVCPAHSLDVYAAYLAWCKRNGETRPRPSNMFTGAITHQAGWVRRKVRMFKDHRDSSDTETVWMVLPPDLAISAELKKPEDVTLTRWYTDCRFAFSEAMKPTNTWEAPA